MAAPAGDKDRVASGDGDFVEETRDVTALECRFESLLRRPILKARVQRGIGIGVEQVPHFRFGFAMELGGFVGGRMDLDGERVSGVENLGKQREARALGQSFPKDGIAHIHPKLMEARAREVAVVDDTLDVLPIHNLPAFADGAVSGERALKLGLHFAPAPDAVHVVRLEGEWLLKAHLALVV